MVELLDLKATDAVAGKETYDCLKALVAAVRELQVQHRELIRRIHELEEKVT